MILNLPNVMTLARIAMVPVIIALLYIPEAWAGWTALIIYLLAAVTDFLDGYYARKMKLVSEFGRFLDPIADKILVGALLIALAALDRLDGWWVLPALVIIIRELFVSGLREFLGPKNITMPVTIMAKWKTTVQMIALGVLIIGDYAGVLFVGQLILCAAAIMTAITGWQYFQVGMKHMKG